MKGKFKEKNIPEYDRNHLIDKLYRRSTFDARKQCFKCQGYDIMLTSVSQSSVLGMTRFGHYNKQCPLRSTY